MNAVIPAAMAPADGQQARQDPGDGRYAATAVMVETGVVLTPENGRLVIDVHGNLAGILAIAHGKAPRQGPMGLCREPCRTQATTASIVCRNTKAARGGGRCG